MFRTFIVFAMLTLAAPAAHADTARIPLAMAAIPFTDTSGEARDQTVEHKRRQADFVVRLKQELDRSGKFDLADIACADPQCRPQDTLAKARSEGKRYVVFGGLQKTSSLVLWARIDVVDAKTEKVVVTRLITFRGDTDESWSRTARFIGRAINAGFAR